MNKKSAFGVPAQSLRKTGLKTENNSLDVLPAVGISLGVIGLIVRSCWLIS